MPFPRRTKGAIHTEGTLLAHSARKQSTDPKHLGLNDPGKRHRSCTRKGYRSAIGAAGSWDQASSLPFPQATFSRREAYDHVMVLNFVSLDCPIRAGTRLPIMRGRLARTWYAHDYGDGGRGRSERR